MRKASDRWRDLFFVVLVIAASWLASCAGGGTYGSGNARTTVSGTVTDASGASLAGAEITLTDSVGVEIASTGTDNQGNYKFELEDKLQDETFFAIESGDQVAVAALSLSKEQQDAAELVVNLIVDGEEVKSEVSVKRPGPSEDPTAPPAATSPPAVPPTSAPTTPTAITPTKAPPSSTPSPQPEATVAPTPQASPTEEPEPSPTEEEFLLGDMDCDGVVNDNDLNPFVTAVVSKTDYEAEFPDCRWLNGDINGDGSVNVRDIDGFNQLLGSTLGPGM